jgi:hypothetical protein
MSGMRWSQNQQCRTEEVSSEGFAAFLENTSTTKDVSQSNNIIFNEVACNNRSNREGGDGLVRHPYDSKAWKHFHNNVDQTFGNDTRNFHFALAVDGVNPFKQTRSTWLTWPVMLLNYNLPP